MARHRAGRGMLLAMTWLALVHAHAVCAQEEDATVRRTVAVMGTLAAVSIWGESEDDAREAGNAAIREIERVEGMLSSWSDDTEIGRLNGTPTGVGRRASDELRHLLDDVALWSRWSGGAFHPAVGALVDVWDLRGAGRRPSAEEIQAALAATGDAGVRFDGSTGIVTRLQEGAWIDSGGFGKGAALRSAGDSLRARGIRRARLDLGGQLLLIGAVPVTVGVAHPDRRSEVAATLRVAEVSVATSGQSERGVEVDGLRVGHILDPRSGHPVPAWGSVTVVARDALVADVLATALYVLGPSEGFLLAQSLSDIGVLFLEDRDGEVRASYNSAMSPYVGRLPEGGHRIGGAGMGPEHP